MTIELLDLELHGYHGVLPGERRDGQRFLVDLWLDPRGDAGSTTDRIGDAIDYREIVSCVAEVFGERVYDLLEALATALADGLLERFSVTQVRVRVRKPEVVLACPVRHAAVIVERRASGM
jgi:dihydroneopterin aldolase